MNAHMFALPFTTWKSKPALGEPAHGYFNVLVAAELHTSARVYAQEIEMNGRDIVPEEILDRLLLLPLGEEHKDSLRRWTPTRKGGHLVVSGEIFRRKQVSFKKRRFCRACLAESPRHRTWWDLVNFHFCPFHSQELETTTTQGDTLRWWWPSFEFCPDGTELGRPAPRREDVDGFEHYLLQRLGVHDGSLRPMLDGIPLHEVVDVCETLGRFLGNAWTMGTPSRRASDCRLGFTALSADEAHLERVTQEWIVGRVAEANRYRGYKQGIGWIADLTENRPRSMASLWPRVDISLRRAFARVGHMGRGYQRGRDLPHGDRTMKEIAVQLDRPVVGLRALANQLGIKGKRSGPAARALLSQQQTEALSFAVQDMISTKCASEILGCSQSCVRDLIRHGTLEGYARTRLFGQEGQGSVVRKSDVLELLRSIEAASGPSSTPKLSRGFGQHVKMERVTAGQLLADVLAGRVVIAGLDGNRHGIGSWRFALPDETYQRTAVPEAGSGEIAVLEAQAASGFSQPEFAHIVRAGLVGEVRTNGRSSFLSKIAFDRFAGRYVNARLFMHQLGAQERKLDSALEAASISRCFTKISATPIYIVERADLEVVIGSLGGDIYPPVWLHLRVALKESCPPFVIPERGTGDILRGYLSSRTTFIEFRMGKKSVVVSKGFSSKAPREWRVFRQFESSIRKEWSMFTWVDRDDGSVRAEFEVLEPDDVDVVIPALTAFLSRFRNRRRLP